MIPIFETCFLTWILIYWSRCGGLWNTGRKMLFLPPWEKTAISKLKYFFPKQILTMLSSFTHCKWFNAYFDETKLICQYFNHPLNVNVVDGERQLHISVTSNRFFSKSSFAQWIEIDLEVFSDRHENANKQPSKESIENHKKRSVFADFWSKFSLSYVMCICTFPTIPPSTKIHSGG